MRILIVFLLMASVATADTALLPPELDQIRTEGFNALFNMNYDEAKASFEKMIKLDPNHPAGHIYLANTIWLGHLATLRRLQTGIYNRSDAFFKEETKEEFDPRIDKEFRQAMSKGMALAERKLSANKNEIQSLYYLGIAKNITAGYEATVKRSFFSALRNGSKGVGLHRKAIEKDPALLDADLSIGLYNYVVGSLPLAVKILVFLGGVHGSKKEGLRKLERVAKEGNYARDEAAVLLIMLYNREKRLQDALKLLEQFMERYPGNMVFRLEMATTLAQLSRYAESARVFEAMLNDSKAASYMPDMIHYKFAEAMFDAKLWEKAYDHYTSAISSSKAPQNIITMSHLGAGQCLDAMGKRDQAKAEYEIVLKRKETLDSHDQAKKYLKKPFNP